MSDSISEGAEARPDISILIVGYNSAGLIGRCLGSIPGACEKRSYQVLLVDQGDGMTQTVVEKQFADTIIIPSRGNLGFAGGNNLLAVNSTGRYLLLLNPDVELQPGSIDALFDAAQVHHNASAWGGVTLDRTGEPDVGNTVHVPSLSEMASRILGRSNARLSRGRTFDEDERVDVLSGGFVLIARDAWDAAGGLDERYFLYCEEVDFFYRLGKAGYTFWRIASARAYHDIGHGEVVSPMRTLYRAAGIMQFARIHWSPAKQMAAFGLMWLAALQRFVLGSLLGVFAPRHANLADSHRRLALMPCLWRYGYDPKRGLLAQLKRNPLL